MQIYDQVNLILRFDVLKIKAYVKLFRIKQSTESNHENKTSKDVVPLPSCVHPKRM